MSENSDLKETGRVEAFSDGVFAVAITLLVLDIKVPHGISTNDGLWLALEAIWPPFLGFLLSFFTIGIMWMNHHRLFRLIRRTDDGLNALNALLLLVVTFVPFPTALLAEYLALPAGRTAAIFYSGTCVFLALAFNLLWWYVRRENRLVSSAAQDRAAIEEITRQYAVGPLLYMVSLGAAFFSVGLSLGINLMLAVFFALPGSALAKLGRRIS